MRFKIGSWRYRCAIAMERIFGEDGRELAGRCDWKHGLIEISPNIPLAKRLDVLLHELRHAWQFHLGRPITDEDDANNASSFTAWAMTELERQGGVAALMRMTPAGTLEPTPEAQVEIEQVTIPSYAAQCGVCRSMYGAASVVTEQPIFDEGAMRQVVRRVLYCDSCNHIQIWFEGATTAGKPNGTPIGEPVWRTGEVVREFLMEHGDKCGVSV